MLSRKKPLVDVDVIESWARAVCHAGSSSVRDVSAAMGIDVAGARQIGCQLVLTPPEGTDHFELVLDLDTGQRVMFAEFTLAQQLPLDALRARFGDGELVMSGPHQAMPTVVFDPVCPAGSPRACAVLADLSDGDPADGDPADGDPYAQALVRSVMLYPRPLPGDG